MSLSRVFKVLPDSLQRYSAEQLKAALLLTSAQLAAPFALYRLPGKKASQFMVQLQGDVCYQPLSLENLPRGFAINSFLPKKEGAGFIKAELEFVFDEFSGIQYLFQEDTLWLSKFLGTLEKNLQSGPAVLPAKSTVAKPDNLDQKALFEELVEKAIKGIKKGKYQKVVASRRQEIKLPDNFNALIAWQQLTHLYPDSFVSLVSLPGKGIWLGASPELLLQYQPGQHLSTMALAGTQSSVNGQPDSPVKWEEKEKTEQELVSKFIRNCFDLLGVENYQEEPAVTLKTGHLLHLCSRFQLPLSENSNPGIASRMLELLHPTPAVCGTPRDEALGFLKREEGYDRELYSGYLGPVDAVAGSKLFVNLRCMQLFEGTAWLYAGAGITRESEPEKEWKETELKIQTLLRAL